MDNEVRLNIKLPKELLDAAKAAAKEKQLTVSSLTRVLLSNYINSENRDVLCVAEIQKPKIASTRYHDVAQKKRELKQRIAEAHEEYLQYRHPKPGRYVTAYGVELARQAWKQAINEYKTFCAECRQTID